MLNYILLETSAFQNAIQNMDIKQIILLVGFVAVFYFFMIRPQQKRQKDQLNFVNQIKKGDTVVTIGGIHGKIYEINDPYIILEVDTKGTKITFSKSAISIESTKKLQTSQPKQA